MYVEPNFVCRSLTGFIKQHNEVDVSGNLILLQVLDLISYTEQWVSDIIQSLTSRLIHDNNSL